MHFKVKTSFIGQPQDFLQDKANILDEKWIDKGVNNLPVFISWVFIQYYMILNKEMRDIIVQIH